MRARTAFEHGTPHAWQAAMSGDKAAIALISKWLARDGLIVESMRFAQGGSSRGDDGLKIALAKLSRVRSGMQIIQPAQIVAARFGDFSRLEVGGQVGVKWNLRQCSWAKGMTCNLMGQDFQTWRTIAAFGRIEPPGKDEPLLAPLMGKPWSTRAVRYAIAMGLKLLRGENHVQPRAAKVYL